MYFPAPDWLLPYFVGWILFSFSLKYGSEIYHSDLNSRLTFFFHFQVQKYFIIVYIFKYEPKLSPSSLSGVGTLFLGLAYLHLQPIT